MYVNDRKPYRGRFVNTAKMKIGKESLPCRLDTLNQLDFDWLNESMSEDAIRVNLKRHIGFGL